MQGTLGHPALARSPEARLLSKGNSRPYGAAPTSASDPKRTVKYLVADEPRYYKVGNANGACQAMLTVEDVTAVPLFSALPKAELERLARTSADLRLSPGEFAVPRAESAPCSPF